MSDISLIEWLVYGFMSYSSILMLIISTIKDVPVTKALSIIRVIYLIPGVISSAILATSGIHITGFSQSINTIIRAGNGTILTNSTQVLQPQQITVLSPVWQMVHIMIMLVLIVYVIQQILIFFTTQD